MPPVMYASMAPSHPAQAGIQAREEDEEMKRPRESSGNGEPAAQGGEEVGG